MNVDNDDGQILMVTTNYYYLNVYCHSDIFTPCFNKLHLALQFNNYQELSEFLRELLHCYW